MYRNCFLIVPRRYACFKRDVSPLNLDEIQVWKGGGGEEERRWLCKEIKLEMKIQTAHIEQNLTKLSARNRDCNKTDTIYLGNFF